MKENDFNVTVLSKSSFSPNTFNVKHQNIYEITELLISIIFLCTHVLVCSCAHVCLCVFMCIHAFTCIWEYMCMEALGFLLNHSPSYFRDRVSLALNREFMDLAKLDDHQAPEILCLYLLQAEITQPNSAFLCGCWIPHSVLSLASQALSW